MGAGFSVIVGGSVAIDFWTTILHLGVLPLAVGYLMGSIPYGLILGWCCGIGDLRSHGSGNIGATNAWRVGGKKLGGATLVLDVLKGLLTVALSNWMGWESTHVGAACVVGHIAPLWLGFRGGKGVATYLGVLLGWYWPCGLLCLAIWGLLIKFTRISALASIVACGLSPLILLLLSQSALVFYAIPLASLIIYRHKDNIRRLLNQQESRL